MIETTTDLEESPYVAEIEEPPASELGDPIGPWRVEHIGIRRPYEVGLFQYEEGDVPPGQFRVKTLYVGISAGTELTHFTGSNPYMNARWDDNLKLFMPDGRTQYPMMFSGYMQVGQVVASRCERVREGQMVAMTYGHKSGHTCDPAQEVYVALPDGIDPMLGIYAAQMGPICA